MNGLSFLAELGDLALGVEAAFGDGNVRSELIPAHGWEELCFGGAGQVKRDETQQFVVV
jgi:hypothetical protein